MAWYDVLQGLGQGLRQAGEISTAQRAQRRQLAREEYESLGEDAEIDAETVRRLATEGGLSAGAFRRLPSGNYGRSLTLGERQFAAAERDRQTEKERQRAETMFAEIDETQTFDPKDEAAKLLQQFYPGLLEPTEDKRQLRVRLTAPAIVKRNAEREATRQARQLTAAQLDELEAAAKTRRANEAFKLNMESVLQDPDALKRYQASTSPEQRVYDAKRLEISSTALLTPTEAKAYFESSPEGQAAKLRIPPPDQPDLFDRELRIAQLIAERYKLLVDLESGKNNKPLLPAQLQALRKQAENEIRSYFIPPALPASVLPSQQRQWTMPTSVEPTPQTSLPTRRKLYPE